MNTQTLKQISKTQKQFQQATTYEFTPLAHQVIQMFQSQYTQNLPDRKANSVINYCKQRVNGFFYQEIEQLTKIVKYALNDLFSGVVQMVPALRNILQVWNQNKKVYFNKLKSSDQLNFGPLIPGFLNSFIPLLSYENYKKKQDGQFENLRYYTILFLNKFSYQKIAEIMKMEQSFENKKNQGYQISPLQKLIENGTKNLHSLFQSSLITPLMELLYKYSGDAEYLYPLLEIFSYMIMYRKLAQHLCQKDLLRTIIILVFNCDDFRSYIVKICLQIIWNAIEGIGVKAIRVFVNRQIIFQLKGLFKSVMAQGYKLEDKCLRNQIMIMVNYLLANPQSIEFFLEKKNLITNQQQYSFFQNLVGCASIDQQTFYDTRIRMGDKKAEFGTNIEDLQFKKLIWSGILIAIQSNNQQVIYIIHQVDFIKYLLLYLDPMANSYAVNRWSAPQLRQIQLHCLGILANIILYMKDDFEEKKGLIHLTKFLSNTTDPQRREKCLKAFNNASLFQQQYKLKITDQGLIDILIQYLQQGQENSLDIKQLCFSIIANLCSDCKKNKKLFREKGGIQIVINYLKDINVATSGRYTLLALSILNCLWNAILGSRRSESQFLDNQGLYVILEFLEECDNIHKKMGLSCLSYLIQNQKSITSFSDWNSGKTMINATQLLINIYQKQDERYGVRYQNGIIKNKFRPLTPKKMKQQLNVTKKNSIKEGLGEFTEVGTQAYLLKKIKEKVNQYDLRAIVFSILYRTGFNKNDLHASQQQKIEVIQMYPHFKVGQIWTDIKQQLQQQGIKATSDDEHWMKTSIQQFQQQISNCINTQLLINREFHKIEQQDLSKFYQIIKNNKQVK